MTLTLGSLFDGIAAFPLAFQRAGVETRWVVELDAQCRRVSARHFPRVTAYADVRDVDGATLAPVDIITAGFPCQDLSVAGRRAGLAGDRSGLFFEIPRIVREMREATDGRYPEWVVLENVPGLTSAHRGWDFAAVLDSLADVGALDIAYRILNAQHFGVAQRRRRVFIVASFRAGASAAQVLFEPQGGRRDPAPRRAAGQGLAATLTSGTARGRGVNQPGRRAEDDVNLIPDRAYCLAAGAGGSKFGSRRDGQDTFVPTLATGDLARQSSKGVDSDATTTLIPTISGPRGGRSGEGGFRQDRDNHGAYLPVAFHLTQDPISSETVAPAMGSSSAHGSVAVAFAQNQRDEVRDLGSLSGESAAQPGMKQQTYVAQAVAFTERTRANGRNVEAQADLAYSLNNPGAGGRTQENRVVTPTMAVRRLTPTECERLMGLPDGWTEGHANSARYRMLGNSVAVPVVEWIAKRIVGAS